MTSRATNALLLCLGCALLAPVAAQHKADDKPLSRGIEAALLELGARDALGDVGKPLSVSRPAQVRYELGAVVDVRSTDANGPKILAITPGGAAERLQLQPGDRLLAINGTRLAGASDAGAALETALRGSDGRLQVEVARNGQPVTASGRADVAAIPAYQVTVGADPATRGCGYVTTELGVVPLSRNIFPAVITKIDGRSTPLLYRLNRHRLESGDHVLVIDETIPRSRLNKTQQQQIKLMRKREQKRAYKPLVVEVKPNVSYRIGARLIKDQLDGASIRANEYWEPVVWEEKPAACR